MNKLSFLGKFEEVGTELPDFHNAFFDGDGKDLSVSDGIRVSFPIIRLNDVECKPIATGFFISNNGMFVTAKHVMEENGLSEEDLAGIEIIRSENRIIVREVIKFVSHPKADLAVGILRTEGDHTNKIVPLTMSFPKIGDKIKTWSFPAPQEAISNEGKSTISFTFLANDGIITNHFLNGRDKFMLPYNCFEAKMEIKGGSSGGAVAFGSGYIFGINSTGFDGTDISYITSIHALFDLSLPDMLPPGETEGREMSIVEMVNRGLIIVK